jgi:hypothetical protein
MGSEAGIALCMTDIASMTAEPWMVISIAPTAPRIAVSATREDPGE